MRFLSSATKIIYRTESVRLSFVPALKDYLFLRLNSPKEMGVHFRNNSSFLAFHLFARAKACCDRSQPSQILDTPHYYAISMICHEKKRPGRQELTERNVCLEKTFVKFEKKIGEKIRV